MGKKKYTFLEKFLMTVVAIGLTLVVGGLFGAIVAYEVIDIFEVSLDTGILIGGISGLIGGIAVGYHTIEDFFY